MENNDELKKSNQRKENIIPVYECNCSRERFEKGLISLGKQQLKDIIEEDEKIETVCNFCNKKYVFDKEYIEKLIKELEE